MTIEQVNSLVQLTPAVIPYHGWIPLAPGASWNRYSATEFESVEGDYSAYLRPQTKVRWTEGGGSYRYGVIQSSVYPPNPGDTWTRATLYTNSDFPIVNVTMEDVCISNIENPAGFPDWFNFTTTPSRSGPGNYTNLPTINFAKWRISGKLMTITLRATMNATPGGAGYQIYTLPVNPANSALAVGMQVSGLYSMACILDAGSGQLRAWKYDSTADAVGSAIYSFSGSYNIA